jgi:hypothetical protein
VTSAGNHARRFPADPAPGNAEAVTITRRRLAVLLPALALAVAGCAGTIDGTGSTTNRPSSGGNSTPDFPSGSPTDTEALPTPSSAAPSDSTHPVPASPLRTATVTASGGRTYIVKIWADVKDDTCFDHAYGTQMITFLTEHPCSGLERILATTTVGGRDVGFAESSTGFPGTPKDPYKDAGEFSKLELADGTGSIKDLMMDGYRLPSGPSSVPGSEAFNVLGQDNGVTVWDAWYLTGSTPADDKALIRMTQDLFLQF